MSAKTSFLLSVDGMIFYGVVLIIPLLSYIIYHYDYFRIKASHKNYQYYPLFKQLHRFRNMLYFKWNGKHSCYINTKQQSTTLKQNDALNTQYSSSSSTKSYARIVCISDTHELHHQLNLPDGDILIHCGDILFANYTNYSEKKSIQKIIKFNEWLGTLPHKHKIIVAGNHDYCFEQIGQESVRKLLTNATYLINERINIKFGDKEIKLFCSPYSIPNSKFSTNRAFQCERDEIGKKVWNKIPDDIDVLVTHHMPDGYLGTDKGCVELLKIIKERCLNMKYHVFGHWHGTYGVKFGVDNGKDFKNENRENVCFINASSVDDFIAQLHPPVVFDYSFDSA